MKLCLGVGWVGLVLHFRTLLRGEIIFNLFFFLWCLVLLPIGLCYPEICILELRYKKQPKAGKVFDLSA